MPYQLANAFLLEFKNDATPTAAYATVAGVRTRSIAFNQEIVDVTNSSSTGNWRELLQGAGVRSAAFSGAGVLDTGASASELYDAFNKRELRDCRITVPGFGTFEGRFAITSLSFSGEHHQQVDFDISLESAGAITFTAI